jgi:hypothetical protein
LETLRLTVLQTTAVSDVVLLTQLGEMRVPLQELHLLYQQSNQTAASDSTTENVTPQMQALESILQSTTTLHRLTLGSFHFAQASISHLLAGLSANRTVTALAFVEKCCWDTQAARAFVDYLRRPVKSSEPSPLKELHVNDLTFEGFSIVDLLEEMFTVPPAPNNALLCNTYCTIGSSVQIFESSGAGSSLSEMMNILARNAQTMRLGTVRISKLLVSAHEVEAFRRNLPKLLYLKDLTIGHEKKGFTIRWDMGQVLEALRTNGSLERLSMNRMNFTVSDKQRLGAYLTRNESLPVLLANPPPLSSGPAKNPDGPLDLSLFPSLFEVSKSMPAMSANMILVGLLAAAGNSRIGPTTLNRKRTGMSDISNR